MKNGIVILNYLNSNVTKSSVERLMNQKDIAKFEVVIVDNGSPEAVLEDLKDFLKSDVNFSGIHLIRAHENLGFAKGHNIGIRFLRKLNVENILLMNSDISFVENEGLSLLFSNIKSSDAAIIGPNIYGKGNKPANPVFINVTFKGTVLRSVSNRLSVIRNSSLFRLQKENVSEGAIGSRETKSINSNERMFFLHGSAFILTKKYFDTYFSLYPGTFLYYESQILQILVKKANLKLQYCADVHMTHIEDQSSELSYGNKPNVKASMVAQSQMKALGLFTKTVSKINRGMINGQQSFEVEE